MGLVSAVVTVTNYNDSSKGHSFIATVDTGATYLTLPAAWQYKFGDIEKVHEVEVELATGEVRRGEVYAPLRVNIDSFRPIICEVMFLEMELDKRGGYEPLIGYLPLETIPVGVDMLNNRLFRVRAKAK